MRKPPEPSERLAKLPPHVSTPLAPREQAQDRSDYHKRNGSAWTFTVPGEDDVLVHNTQPIFPNLNLPGTINESPESQAIVDPHVCGLCGTLNSPNTHYNAQGIWLCTACRSPASAKEVPPPPQLLARYQNGTGLAPDPQQRKSTRRDEDEEKFLFTEGQCECCDSFLPPIKIFELDMYTCQWRSKELIDPASEPEDTRQSMKPEPLRSYHQRSASTNTPVTPLISDPFARFDSDDTFTRRQSPEFQEMFARRSRDMHRTNEDDFRPPPPKKDDGYVRKDSSTSEFDYDYGYDNDVPPPAPPSIKDAPLLSSKAFKPPTLPSRNYSRNSTRQSFYPDTPIHPPSPPHLPSHHPKSPTPLPCHLTQQENARPKTASKAKTRISPRTPTPPGIPSDFHYTPPPIPDETVHRLKRSSSIYPEDGDGRYTLSALEFAARSRNEAPEKRNTNFYDFWKPILEEKSRGP